MWRLVHQWSFLLFWLSFDFFGLFWRLVHCWYSLGRHVTIGTPMVIFAVLTVFWLFFDDWYTAGTLLVDLWRLVHQWFWVFLTIGTVYESAKNGHWCTNRHMSKQTPPNTQNRANAATSRDLYHMCLGSGWLYVSTWTSMRLAPVRCRVLLHSLLPTDDACSWSGLSTIVIKFSIFSDPTRKLSALPPELRRIW